MQEARLGQGRFPTPGFFSPFCGKIFHFFRDVLAAKGKGLDARQKLEKMRNLKVGN